MMTLNMRRWTAWACLGLLPLLILAVGGWLCQLRKNYEQEHRRALFFAELVARSREAVVVVDDRGVITQWNHGAEELFGLSAAETVGYGLGFLIPPEHRAAHREKFNDPQVRERLLNGGVSRHVAWASGKNGRIRVAIRVTAVRTDRVYFYAQISEAEKVSDLSPPEGNIPSK